MRKCPYCAEEIQEDARLCKWCKSDLTAPLPAGPDVQPETSGMAIASLVCGFLFFVFPAALAAIILGHISRGEIRRSAGRKTGGGMALAGLIMGYVGVSIIPFLIIAAIAIPNLLRARITANETSAVGSLRTLNTAIASYAGQYAQVPANLAVLGPSATPSKDAADLIDIVLAGGQKSGYFFVFEATDSDGDGRLDGYRIEANPVTPGTTGQRYFFTDHSGVIRMDSRGPANENSPPIM